MAYINPRSRKAKALLDTIGGPESAGQYNRRYHPTGVRTFSDYSAHPNVGEKIGLGPNAGKISTAAGKYQITNSTWGPLSRQLGLTDFTPSSQDLAAFGLAKQVAGPQLAGAFSTMDPQALSRLGQALSKTWTSLPGGIEQQLGPKSFANKFAENYAALGAGYPEASMQSLMSPTPISRQYMGPEAGFAAFSPASLPNTRLSSLAPSMDTVFDVAGPGPQNMIAGATPLGPRTDAFDPSLSAAPGPVSMVRATPTAPASPAIAGPPAGMYSNVSNAVNPMADAVGGLPTAASTYSAPSAFGTFQDPLGAPAPGKFTPGQFGSFSPVAAVSVKAPSAPAAPAATAAAPAPSSVSFGAPQATQAEREAATAALRAGLSPSVKTVQTSIQPGLTDAQIGMGQTVSAPSATQRVADAFGQMPGPSVAPNGVVHYGTLTGLNAPATAPAATVAAPSQKPAVSPTAETTFGAPAAAPGTFSAATTFGPAPGAFTPAAAPVSVATVAAPKPEAPATPQTAAPGTPGAVPTAAPAPISAPAPIAAPAPKPVAAPIALKPLAPAAPAPMATPGAVTVKAPAQLTAERQLNPQQATAKPTAQPEISITAGAKSAGDFARAMARQVSAKKAAVNSAGPEGKMSGTGTTGSKTAGAGGGNNSGGGGKGASSSSSSSKSTGGSKSSGGTASKSRSGKVRG